MPSGDEHSFPWQASPHTHALPPLRCSAHWLLALLLLLLCRVVVMGGAALVVAGIAFYYYRRSPRGGSSSGSGGKGLELATGKYVPLVLEQGSNGAGGAAWQDVSLAGEQQQGLGSDGFGRPRSSSNNWSSNW